MEFTSIQPSTSAFVNYNNLICINPSNDNFQTPCDMNTRSRRGNQGPPALYYGNFRRNWEKNVRPPKEKYVKNSQGLPLVILSYNILAQTLLENHSYLYQDSPPDALSWEFRFSKIFEEISTLNPDFACLQEVQASHLKVISDRFKKMGYSGIYKQRTGIREDGCAIFYKSKSFQLLANESVEFRQPDISILNRDNIGMMAKFVSKVMPSAPFVICTTHLLYNPKRSDIRLAQMQIFLAEIDRFAFVKNSTGKSYLPIILTGDFNSPPDSKLNQFIHHGHIETKNLSEALKLLAITNSCQHLGVYMERRNEMLPDSKLTQLYHSENDNNDKETDITYKMKSHLFNNTLVKHNLGLKSVYNHSRMGQLEATSFQDEWLTVDYIYYNSDSTSSYLYLTDRLQLPVTSECKRFIGHIPNFQFSSDHLCLCAKFMLYSQTENSPQQTSSKI